MKNLNFIIASCLLAVTTSCKTVNPTSATTGQNAPYQNLGHNGKIYSAFYQQRAAEYEALCLQAYNIAKFRLDEALAQKSDRQLAIVSDIDETFLDNSYYAVERSKMGKNYDQKTWEEWTAKELLHLLQVRRNSISMQQAKAFRFYITNRAEHERAGTLKNLKSIIFLFKMIPTLFFGQKKAVRKTVVMMLPKITISFYS